jgi:predicted nucleic acid-binding protein
VAVVLDSDAVIGFLDRNDALHDAADAAVRNLVSRELLFVSVVTYAEVLTGARLGHHDERQVRGFFSDLISEVLPVDMNVADVAADLRSRRKSLLMPDAMILATAEVQPEVGLVVTGDLQATKVSGLGFKAAVALASALSKPNSATSRHSLPIEKTRFAGKRAGATGLEPATSGVTGRRSNQLSYAPEGWAMGCPAGIISGSLDLEAEGSAVGSGRGDQEA